MPLLLLRCMLFNSIMITVADLNSWPGLLTVSSWTKPIRTTSRRQRKNWDRILMSDSLNSLRTTSLESLTLSARDWRKSETWWTLLRLSLVWYYLQIMSNNINIKLQSHPATASTGHKWRSNDWSKQCTALKSSNKAQLLVAYLTRFKFSFAWALSRCFSILLSAGT